MIQIRAAEKSDIPRIAGTYQDLLRFEQKHGGFSNWKLDVYPTAATAEEAVVKKQMVVLEDDGALCASMRLNDAQAPEYEAIPWQYPAKKDEVLVIHTLCVSPSKAGHGYGTALVRFAKQWASDHEYKVIRLDTYAHNEPAKALYLKNGFRIAGTGRILLAGKIDEDQVYLEHLL
jgi:ribosomal protein S18 acetylase RimI-like enzyme